MHISKIFQKHKITFSFEFFPPKNAAASESLFTTIGQLAPLKPSFVSVTYGAGGSTRTLTHDLVTRLEKETDLTVVSHLTAVCSTHDEIADILDKYSKSGIRNVLALSGDPPNSQSDFYCASPDGFADAVALVSFIRKCEPFFGIGVAGFPEGHKRNPNRLTELDYLKAKVDAGADYICTQLFFDNHEFYDFRERCILAGVQVPIIAGIMPITSRKGMVRMAELSPYTRFPARLQKAIARAENDEFVEKVGVHWATEQVRDLIDNDVRGVHFYTLNKSKATLQIYDSLGVSSSQKLE